ncbi:LysM peptidoglycan-binding domain-containing protein [Streptomyces sp. NRRL S-350]|uniref:LysM peptidoglycan-binding domain-containing protein n=1 Tax=Streptomyces sp. NRRL S-350 TaxID=1463902 RepID=UPI00068FA2CD|nr:LysM peptidoglycan-binding domain-containing protein [Streptomyces sp. NRRL S-350]
MAAPRAKDQARTARARTGRDRTGRDRTDRDRTDRTRTDRTHADRDGSGRAHAAGRRSAAPSPRPPSRGGRAGALVTALAALAALAVLLIGVPALLLYGTQAVAGMGEVAPGGIGEALTSPDDGHLFLWALVVVGWLAWACFAFSVLLEIPAQLRGRVARRIPAFGWSQRLAAGLVGSVLALLPVAGSAFAAVPELAHSPAVQAQLTPGVQRAALPAAQSAPVLTPAAEQQPTYTVRDSRPADSLWSIAERQLGSGERWVEIAKLNDGRVMEDSGVRFDADRPIQPGWDLLMPADAKPDEAKGPNAASTPAPSGDATQGAPGTAQATPPANPQADSPTAPQPGESDGSGGRHTVTVQAGDSLSAIAQRELGDGEEWPKLFEANKGVQAPDGERLTNPDVVVPGMVLTVPGAAAAPAPAPAPVPAPVPAPEQAPAPAPAPAPAEGQAPAPASQAPATQAPATQAPAPGAPQSAPAPAPAAHADPAPSGDYTVALTASTVGVLLAAIMVGTVAHKRGTQQRARRPRHRIAMPGVAAAAFENELMARQDQAGLELLDRALRTLARNTVRGGKRLPAIVAARITPGHTVELHLSGPATPIAPFRAAHAANVWWCSAESGEMLSAAQARKTAAPYPALVTLGTSPDGSVVLADLEAVRLLHLSGHPDDARDVLRTLAVELAHSPLADRLHLHLVDLAEEVPISGPAAERVHRHATLEAALAALGPRTAKARATLVAAEAASPRDARSRGQADEAWTPEIVLCAHQPGGDIPAELGRLLDARPRTCVAVITRAPERGTGPVARWTLPTSGQAAIPGLHLTVELQRLSGPQYDQVAELLRVADDTTQHPAPAWTLDGPEDTDTTELPRAVPVLAAVGAPGGADEEGAGAAAGPRLLARVIGTGASPFAGTDPVTPLPGPVPGPTSVPVGPARFAVNGQGRQAAADETTRDLRRPSAPDGTGEEPGRSAGEDAEGIGGEGIGGEAVAEAAAEAVEAAAETAGTVVLAVQPVVPRPAAAEPAVPEPVESRPVESQPVESEGGLPEPGAQAPGQQAVDAATPAPSPVPAAGAEAAVRTEADETDESSERDERGETEAALAPAAAVASGPVAVEPGPAAVAPVARTTSGRSDSDDLLGILRSPEAHAPRNAPRIRLLGPVDVAGALGSAEPGALPRLTELAVYLALRPGSDHHALDHDLHPGAAHLDPHPTAGDAKSPLPGKLADLAAWFGTSPDGLAFLPVEGTEGYSFAPTVTCDWDEFRSLYRRGMRSTSATADAALAHALALVRGAPFAEAPPASFGWAEAERQDMIAAIVDTAHELAARRLQYGDHRSAEAAVFRGLAVAPDVELLHRDLFYAYASAGARDQLLRAVNRLDALSRRTGRDLDADTVALLRDLLAGS